MYPIEFKPITRNYVWGDEIWVLSDREEGMSQVLNGEYQGKSLQDLVEKMGEDLLGHGQKMQRFPLLLKIIDAKENLSIQVHPDELSASKVGGEPKSEMWILLDDGVVLAGLKKQISEKEFRKAIEKKHAEDLLEKFEVKKGEALYLPGGRVHCICGGTRLFEVEQNSNTTFRLYDWGRKGRDLHLEQGFGAARLDDRTDPKLTLHRQSSDLHHQLIQYLSSPHFIVERLDVFDRLHVAAIAKSFQIFFCMQGSGKISVDGNQVSLKVDSAYLVPAAAKAINIEGKCELVRVRLP